MSDVLELDTKDGAGIVICPAIYYPDLISLAVARTGQHAIDLNLTTAEARRIGEHLIRLADRADG